MTRDERRKAMSECTEFIDAMREIFPALTILRAEESGHQWGEAQAEGVQLSKMIGPPWFDVVKP